MARKFSSQLLALLGSFAAAAWRANQQKRKVLEDNYRSEVRKAQSEMAEELAEYDAYVNSLPALVGNGRFDQEVDTTYGDVFALDSYSQYLELMHTPDQPFQVILCYQEGEEEGEIMVEAGQATVGHIPLDQEEEYAVFLEELDSEVRCDARLTKLASGGYDLYLNIARPLRTANSGGS